MSLRWRRAWRTGGGLHQRDQTLAHVVVGDPDAGGVGYPGIGQQYPLRLRRVDVHTAREHQIGAAVGDEHVAVAVHVSDLTESEVAIRPGRGRTGGGRAAISGQEAGRIAEVQDSDLTRRHVTAVFSDGLGGDAGQRSPDRSGVGEPFLGVDLTEDAGFGPAVGLVQDRTPPADHGPLEGRRAAGPSVSDAAQARNVVGAAHLCGKVE